MSSTGFATSSDLRKDFGTGFTIGGQNSVIRPNHPETVLCPIRDAVGPWNCDEIQLHMMKSAFNDYQGGVFLRISEARDSGDGTMRGRIDRYTLNDRMKPLLASPPETFRCNRKWEPEYYAFNICGVILMRSILPRTTGVISSCGRHASRRSSRRNFSRSSITGTTKRTA
jgi:hypothetical protein